VVGAMLSREEVALIKAMSNLGAFPSFSLGAEESSGGWQEEEALPASKANAMSALALECQSRVSSEALTSH